MNLRGSVARGAITLASGQAIGRLFGFGRNVILARLLSPDDFGIAAMFALTATLFETVTNLSPELLLVQAKQGDDVHFQGTVHVFSFLKGVVGAVLLSILAAPISMAFSVPEAEWGFRLLAILPLARGLAHTDIRRVQRNLSFAPRVVVETSADLVALISAWPLARWLGDYSALLWVLIGREAYRSIASHIAAERAYVWAWSRTHAMAVLRFGWPLLVNSLLIFGVNSGERVVIATASTPAILGVYSAAWVLANAPAMMLATISQSIMLPVLSSLQDNIKEFSAQYYRCMQFLALTSALMAMLFILVGDQLITALYGEGYAIPGPVIACLGVTQAVWLLRSGPAQAAIARGDTTTAMAANITRNLALVPLVLVAIANFDLFWIAVVALCGEVAAFVVIVLLNWKRRGVHLVNSSGPLFVMVFGTTGAIAAGEMLGPQALWVTLVAYCAAAIATLLFAALLFKWRFTGSQ